MESKQVSMDRSSVFSSLEVNKYLTTTTLRVVFKLFLFEIIKFNNLANALFAEEDITIFIKKIYIVHYVPD